MSYFHLIVTDENVEQVRAALAAYDKVKQPNLISPEVKEALQKTPAKRAECTFVCFECNEPCDDEPTYLRTSKWGYERPFCDDCRVECPVHCGESEYGYYAPSMEYVHEDCHGSSSEDKDEDEEEEDTEHMDKKQKIA